MLYQVLRLSVLKSSSCLLLSPWSKFRSNVT